MEMGKARRVFNVLSGLLTIFFGIIMLDGQERAYNLMLFFLEAALILRGVRLLSYYVSMARHMVGGKIILYEGVFFLDMGLFLVSIDDLPKMYVLLYLIIGLAISGIVDLLRANEIRLLESGHWKYQAFTGIVKVVVTLICFLNFNSGAILVGVYSFGVIHSGVARIVSAVRPGAIVYIE